jgi:LPS-assembly lipoprotein
MSWSEGAEPLSSNPSQAPLGRRAAVGLLLALAGCGFTPALGTGSAARGLMGAVRADDPATQADYDFVARIEERLGRAGTPAYDLAYGITTTRDGVAITAEGATTRYVLTGEAVWTLTARADGARAAGGTVKNFTGWSATGSTVAGLAAEEDAARRLTRLLADQVVAAMIAALAA